jgi:PmbA protein
MPDRLLDSNLPVKLISRMDKGEVYLHRSLSRSIAFKGWKARGSGGHRKSGCGVRLFSGGRVGSAGTTDLDSPERVVDDAAAAARFGEELDLDLPEGPPAGGPAIHDPALEELDIERMAEWGRRLLDRLKPYKSEADCEITLSTGSAGDRLTNTRGFDGGYRRTWFTAGVGITRVKEGDIYMAGDHFGSARMPDAGEMIDNLAARIEQLMEWRDTVCTAPTGRIPVIYSPYAAAALLTPLLSGANGTPVYLGTSPLAGRQGEKAFDEKLNIFDDGTLDGRPASRPFDAEGMPKRRFSIVDQGVIRDFVLDLRTAAKAGLFSSACARRGTFSPPTPQRSNLVVGEGESSLKEMMAGIREGILLESLLGVGQGNVLSGAFSNPVATAFKIENGEIAGRVKNVSVAGNVYECLKEIAAIGREGVWAFPGFYSPCIRLDNLSVVSGG